MSDAKKCDKCGAFYEPHYPRIFIRKITELTTKTIDLCPVCQIFLENWLDLRPKEAENEPEEEQSSRDDNI